MCVRVLCVSECMKVWGQSRLWPALGPIQAWTSSSNLWPKLSLPSWKENGLGGGGRSYTPGSEGLKACGVCVTGLTPSPDLAPQAVACKLEPLLLRTVG